MTPLTLYNSLSRTPERFEPIDPSNVRVYTCGPTVYNYQHVGNMRAFLFADTLVRTLRWKGWPVTHVVNITDVGHLTSDADAGDDKMERAAEREQRSIWEIAAHYTDTFKADVAALNITSPTRWAVATDHVPQMIAFAEAIEQNCYPLPGGLYFDTSSVPDYGRLARGNAAPEEPETLEGRIGTVEGKRYPADFAVWRSTPPGEHRQMEWDSPWGRGAPGWHLECSVMSREYLGARFDIHTGGIDHREVHHPNEIAQNQARGACADTGANFWMHNNFLLDHAGKMSKSTGEFLRLKVLTDRGYHPLAYRMLCLQAHYRSELEFGWDQLSAASVRLKRLVGAIEGLRAHKPAASVASVAGYREQLDAAVSNDLNTARVLVTLETMLADKRVSPDERVAALADFDAVLGLELATLTRAALRVRPAAALLTEEDVATRLAARQDARKAKDFARSDAIRDELLAAGVEVMDGDILGWDWRGPDA